MPDLASLRRQFAAQKFLSFEDVNGLVRVNIATPAATASIFTQGAHLVAWQPTGEQPGIFFSRKSDLAPGKPLRGGIPIVFPWFGGDKKRDRIDGHPGPSHGFARIDEWTLASARSLGQGAELTFTLAPSALSRSLGFDSFALKMVFTIGRTLNLNFQIDNHGAAPLPLEFCFHSYFHVTDVHETTVHGLEDASFIDKVDNFKRKPAEHAPIHFFGNVDRIYENTPGPLTIFDGTNGRHILIEKHGSNTTVVWNPYKEGPDIGPWDWHEFVAVESANVESNAVTLAPGASTTLATRVSITHPAAS